MRLRKHNPAGEHNITVPVHDEIAKGALNDILSSLSVRNSVPKDNLVRKLRER